MGASVWVRSFWKSSGVWLSPAILNYWLIIHLTPDEAVQMGAVGCLYQVTAIFGSSSVKSRLSPAREVTVLSLLFQGWDKSYVVFGFVMYFFEISRASKIIQGLVNYQKRWVIVKTCWRYKNLQVSCFSLASLSSQISHRLILIKISFHHHLAVWEAFFLFSPTPPTRHA